MEQTVVVSLLQAAQIGKGLLHGRDTQLFTQDIKHSQLCRSRLIFSNELLELLLIPHVNLLNSSHTPASQQQTQKLIEGIGNRKDILADFIGRINGKNHLALSPDSAVVDAIYTGPADKMRSNGGAKVFIFITSLLKLDGREVDL